MLKKLLEKLNDKKIKKLSDRDYFLKAKIPYFCQFASPNRVKEFIYSKNRQKLLENDPSWRMFGFDKKEEYAYWAMNCCGILCLRMILESTNKHFENHREIIEEGIKAGAYHKENGWIHSGLASIAKQHGLGAKRKRSTPKGVTSEILKNHFVIASVSPQLGEKDTPIKNFGHLVLVKGFRIKNKRIEGFYINNPSGREIPLQENAFIDYDRFKSGFTGRIISFWEINK